MESSLVMMQIASRVGNHVHDPAFGGEESEPLAMGLLSALRLRLMGTLRDTPDTDLVAASVSGDREAFRLLLDRHYDRIHRLAWQLTGSRADADDVAQDVCCTLVEKIGSFRGEAKFTTWLCGIVFNACRDLRRRRRTLGAFTERLAVLTRLARGPDGRDLHDAIWLKSAIARLPAAYRETVALVAGQELSHAEAAQILGIAESTVSWRLHEVRRMLGSTSSQDD